MARPQETDTGEDSYCREAIIWSNAQDDSDVFEIDLRDGTGYLESLDLKEFKISLNTAQAALDVKGIKIRILSSSGYWGSNGQEVVMYPNQNALVLFRDYNHPLRVIDCQTMKTTEKMQTIKVQFLTTEDVVLRRDFVYLRFTACWSKNKMRTYRESFLAQ